MNRPIGVGDELAERIASLSPAQRAAFELRYRRRAAAAGRSLDNRSHLIALQTGGTRPPLFCVHPVGGAVFCYLELARQLGPEQPFYGVQAAGLEGEEPAVDRLDELADRYAAAIDQTQVSGPCLLAGWSLGGVIAVEVARQLHARGRRVPLLALIDSPPPRPASALAPYPELLESFVRDVASLLGRRAPSVKDQLEALPAEGWVDHVVSRLRDAGLLVTERDSAHVRNRIEVFLANLRAVSRHALEPYDGRISLLRAGAAGAGAAERWRAYARDVVELPLPGDHYSLLRPPHVSTTAAVLRSCVQGALEGSA